MAELTITKENFHEQAEQADIPVLLDFWATWCSPCRMLAPVVEELAEEYDGRIRVGKVNVDEQPELAARFGIQSIPTLLVLDAGRIVDQTVGYMPKEELAQFVDSAIG